MACDPFFTNVVFLTHLDNTGNPTLFLDASIYSRTPTASGAAAIESSNIKFGTGSLFTPSIPNNSALVLPVASELSFPTGDWTVEMWIYINAASASLMDIAGQASSNLNWILYIDSSGKLHAQSNNSGGTVVANINDSAVFPTNTWVHIAYVRFGDSFLLFNGGALVASTTSAGAILSSAGGQNKFGSDGFFGPGNIYYDEIRLTKGVARYQASFTPPTAAFPDVQCPAVTKLGGAFVPARAFPPVCVAALGQAKPRIYPPHENTTVQSIQ